MRKNRFLNQCSFLEFEELLEKWYQLLLFDKNTSEIKEIIDGVSKDYLYSSLRGRYLLCCYAEAVLHNENCIELEQTIHGWQRQFPLYPSEKQFYFLHKGIFYLNQGRIHDALSCLKKAEEFGFHECYGNVCLCLAEIYRKMHEYIDSYVYADKARKSFSMKMNTVMLAKANDCILILYDKINHEDKDNHLIYSSDENKILT